MNIRTTRRRLGVAAIALALVAAACGGDDDDDSAADATTADASDGTTGASSQPTTGEGSSDESATLTIAINDDPQSLDPAKNGGGPQQAVSLLAYEPLIRAKSDGSSEPALAESWEYVGDDNTVFTMTLREDATFADGTPVTTQSVVDSINYFIATPSPVHSLIETVEAVEALDEQTVQVTFNQSNPNAATLFSQSTNYGDVISPAGMADPEQLGTATFGAGPYVLDAADTVSGDHYSLVPNDKYWNPGRAALGQGRGAHHRRSQHRVQRRQHRPDQRQHRDRAGATPTGGNRGPRSGQRWATVDLSVAHGSRRGEAAGTRRRRCARALNLAINRDAIAAALGDAYAPLSQFAAPGSDGYVDDLDSIEYDPEQATQLLTDAGYEDGFELALASEHRQP